MRQYLFVACLLVVAFAGCLDSDAPESKSPGSDCPTVALDQPGIRLVDPSYDPIAPIIGADPWDFDTTNVRTCSLPAIGQHDLRDGDPHKYIGELDMRGDLDLGAVAVLGSGESPAVYLLNISNRANPEVISVINQAGTYLVDVKITDDGRHLLTASQTIPLSGEVPGPATLASPQGFTVYNIEDRANPTLVTTVVSPDDIGCHMLDYAYIDDTHVVFCVGQNILAYGFIEQANQWIELGFLPYLPEGAATLPVCDVIVVGSLQGNLCSGPHDMTVSIDEETGRRYMVVSHWNAGVRVVDVTQPINEGMVEVGAWTGEGAKHYDGNVHTAMMINTAQGRYIIASPEMTYGGIVSSMWILDASDLSDLQLVAEWYHPGEYTTDGQNAAGEATSGSGLFMTTHQWQVAPTGMNASVHDARIYLTYNHAGIWVLDLGAILAGDNQEAILGFNLARTPLDQSSAVGNAMLNTWDVNVVDGYIYGTDRATGLWIFHYEGDELGDETLRGFA